MLDNGAITHQKHQLRQCHHQTCRAIEALEARAPQTMWRLWLIVYRTELTESLSA